MKRRSTVVGLLGGVGSGKSAVAALFKEYGARTVDADRIAHGVLDVPAVRRRILAWWGPDVLRRGRVDRAEVARRVFESPAERKRLNALVHPRIGRELTREIARARRRGGVLVVEAALLLETGSDGACDVLVYVEAPRAVRSRRAASRGWSDAEWRRRERSQWPLRRKKMKADYVIDNGGTLAAARKQVESILQEISNP